MVACRLQHLVLVVRDGSQRQHLVQDVELGIGALLGLLLLLEELPLALESVLVEALGVDPMGHHLPRDRARELPVVQQQLLLEEHLVSLLLAEVQEVALLSALDDVFAEDAMLEDTLLQEVELARLERASVLRVKAGQHAARQALVHQSRYLWLVLIR